MLQNRRYKKTKLRPLSRIFKRARSRMLAVFYFSLVVAVAFANPVPLLQRNARDTQEVSVDLCTNKEKKLGVNASSLGVVDVNFLLRPRETCGSWYNDDGYTDSGVYHINPEGDGACELTVFCDMCMRADGDGWTVIQRRVNGDLAFHDKGWQDYKKGFGDYLGNYWMGLEKMHRITQSGEYDLYIAFKEPPPVGFTIIRIDHAVYTKFKVGSESEGYKMTIGQLDQGRSSNTVVGADSLGTHNQSKFSTHDMDNDAYNYKNCADDGTHKFGGWWFGDTGGSHCYSVNLNGKYYTNTYTSNIAGYANGITWAGLVEGQYSLDNTIMAIRKSN